MKIFLIGPMGAGKSTTGKNLSERLGYDFFDTDKLIENEQGKKIKEIFKKNGEDFFRNIESEILIKTKNLKNAVISTGGGIVEKVENRVFLENEKKVIFLDSSVERQFQRTKNSSKRPLLEEGDRFKILKNLYEKRIDLYKSLSNLKISMDDLDEEVILSKIENFLEHDNIKS